jgi:GxxExxY protein
MNSNRLSAEQSPSFTNIIEKELSYIIVGAFFRVYNALGFGFLESIYARALEIVLKSLGLRVDREYPIAVYFEGQQSYSTLVRSQTLIEFSGVSTRMDADQFVRIRQIRIKLYLAPAQ